MYGLFTIGGGVSHDEVGTAIAVEVLCCDEISIARQIHLDRDRVVAKQTFACDAARQAELVRPFLHHQVLESIAVEVGYRNRRDIDLTAGHAEMDVGPGYVVWLLAVATVRRHAEETQSQR